jgi:hypothetical protein
LKVFTPIGIGKEWKIIIKIEIKFKVIVRSRLRMGFVSSPKKKIIIIKTSSVSVPPELIQN